MANNSKNIIIGSRSSLLAKEHINIFERQLKKKFRKDKTIIVEKKFFKTSGDKFLNKKISDIGNKGLFSKEIDEALLSHFNVSEAVTFSVPHEILGEDVGAALVLIDKTKTTVAELKEHLKTRIADFKIPRNIVLLEELPKGATGKIQRMNMAKILGFIK